VVFYVEPCSQQETISIRTYTLNNRCLTDESGSSSFYFNNNAYTPDGRTMIYSAPGCIHGMDTATRKTRLIVPNPPRGDTRFRPHGPLPQ